MEAQTKLSHINEEGRIQMVDVSQKNISHRIAVATGQVSLPPIFVEQLARENHRTAKGSIVDTAVLAGIMAAKKTSELIPLCHPLHINHVSIQIVPNTRGFHIRSEIKTNDTTGVEMEALTAVSIAALTIYDMCKALSHDIVIEQVQLCSKSGGKTDFQR